MGILGYTATFFKTMPYQIMPKKMQLRVQEKRLKETLRYAREHSPYYRDLIPEDLDYSKVPPINKLSFIENFDKIVTDPAVTMDRVMENIRTKSEEEGARLDDKYNITMTSGSTGNPTIIIQDQNFQNMMSVSGFLRAYSDALPVIMVGESGGFGIEAAMIRQNMRKAKFVQSSVRMIDVENTSIDDMIEKLKEIGPGTITGYTGVMTIIANKLADKGVKIKEKRIYLSGEKCSEFDKQVLRKAFDCPDIRVIYGCTEAGSIAYECKKGHLHIASDIVKIEPVDENNNPVGYDKLSDKLLLTNMMNRVQPIIRYEVTDRVTLHRGCSCGCKDDWLEIEGRANDNMVFDTENGEVTVPSISLLIAMAGINKNGLSKFRNYQIAVHRNGVLDVVLDYATEADQRAVNDEISERIAKFFAVHGLHHISCRFSAGLMQKTQRGKYKRVYMVKE